MDIEIGSDADYHKKTWFPRDVKSAFTIIEDNMSYMEYIFDKAGNQISIEPIGYTKNTTNRAILLMKVTNNGLSD